MDINEQLSKKVNEIITDNGDKEKLFETLRQYKSTQNLDELLANLKIILDEPSKLELFEYMRPLVLLHHQLEYSQQVPSLPGVKLRSVRLHRRPGESLGFAVRGGFEHGVGIFVTQLTPGSQADRQGLKIGDEIVRVNGFTISEAIHDDVLNLIKSRDDIVLRVTHIGMIPLKEQISTPVDWKYVQAGDGPHPMEIDEMPRKPRELKIFVDTTGYSSFGCGILSGPNTFPGIFIEKVHPGSLAEEVGLEVGDQIVQVNDTNFQNITHEQAKLAIKSSRQLTIVIRQQVGLRLFNQLSGQVSSRNSWRSSSSSNGPDVSNVGSNVGRRQNEESRSLSVPSLPVPSANANTLSDSSTNHSLSPDNKPARSRDLASSVEALDESQLIARELERQSLGSNSRQNKMTAEAPVESSSSSSSIVTVASIHSEYAAVEKGEKDEVQREKTTYHGSGSDSNFSFSSEIRDELEERKKSLQSSPLSGAAAVKAQQKLQGSVRPGLLGMGDNFIFVENVPTASYKMFTSTELDGRPLRAIKYKKTDDLGVSLEGGLGSPLSGKIIVSMIFDDGIAKKSGKMHVGDQLMAVNGERLLDVTVGKAETLLENVPKDMVELLFCESTLINAEDTITYF